MADKDHPVGFLASSTAVFVAASAMTIFLLGFASGLSQYEPCSAPATVAPAANDLPPVEVRASRRPERPAIGSEPYSNGKR